METLDQGVPYLLEPPMWTPDTREQHDRDELRYPSDLSDDEWRVLAPNTQSVKTTEAGGPRGYDAGKKINGRKRHALVDTDGRSLELQVHPASVQDRDGAPAVLQAAHARFPSIQMVFADSVYAGERVANATAIVVEIVRKLPNQVGFKVLPRRWVVERFFSLGQSQPPPRQGFRGHHRLRNRFPPCRLRHAARQAAGSLGLRFKFGL